MRRWKTEEVGCGILLILIAMGGYVPVLMNGLNSMESRFQYGREGLSSPVSRVMVVLLSVGVVLPVLLNFSSLARRFYALIPLLPYMAVAAASVLWSLDWAFSLRRVLSFLIMCLFGWYFGARFSPRSQVRVVLASTVVLAIGSILLVFAAPQYALDHTQHVGAWQGVFAGKNACAMVMMVGLASAMVYRPASPLTRLARMGSVLMFLVIIFHTQSSGAVVLTVLLCALIPMLRQLSKFEKQTRATICALTGCCVAALAVFMIQVLPALTKALNRDPTLTGRTIIWADVMHAIAQRPLLGYGYAAFWTGIGGPSTNIILSFKWAIPNAHDGYLDIWLSLGLVGLACFAYPLLRASSRVWKLMMSNELQQNLWLVVCFFMVLFYNVDESVLIASPSLMWALFVSSVCALEVHARHRSSVTAISDGTRGLSSVATFERRTLAA
jgi:exopolysaccharide production protein ExoQ